MDVTVTVGSLDERARGESEGRWIWGGEARFRENKGRLQGKRERGEGKWNNLAWTGRVIFLITHHFYSLAKRPQTDSLFITTAARLQSNEKN